jgi:hypothetical protein
MPLPPQDPKETYTLDEVQHMVAREMARADIERLKDGALAFQQQLIEIGGSTNAELKHLRESIQAFPVMVSSQITHCREDMRREIEKDFPSKIENNAMERRIEDKIDETDSTLGKQISELDKKVDKIEVKFDKQWLKITIIVATIVACGGVIQWLLVTSKAAQAVIGG